MNVSLQFAQNYDIETHCKKEIKKNIEKKPQHSNILT